MLRVWESTDLPPPLPQDFPNVLCSSFCEVFSKQSSSSSCVEYIKQLP